MSTIAAWQTITEITLALHEVDLPVSGCYCRTEGASTGCVAYAEAARHHSRRARRVYARLDRAGLIASPASSEGSTR